MFKNVIIPVLILFLSPAIPMANDSFDLATEILHMPIASVGEDAYEVEMTHQGGLVFKLTKTVRINASTDARTTCST